MAAMTKSGSRNILITGGAGFIGSNLAARLLGQPDTRVSIFDNLSRPGVEHNLAWLKSLPQSSHLQFIRGDVQNSAELARAVRGKDEIYHLAAQVAVTTSIDDPLNDFEVNALGTVNMLEAARKSGRHPLVLFTSTNKVYGGLDSLKVKEEGTRYRAEAASFSGTPESTPLDFHSPYGCSKGAADQYVRDYARIYDLPTVVFRMSCIAGPRQFGNEDQGWVAHFLYSVLAGRPIRIYGNGLQVRDILHVHDLIDAMQAAREHISIAAGEVYNIGGGMERSASVLEVLEFVERISETAAHCTYSEVRPGDQPLYISDISKIASHTGWRPQRSLEQTIQDIQTFWKMNRELMLAQQSTLARVGDLVTEEVA